MATFKTTDGREYVVRLDAPRIKACRDATSVDLGALDFSSAAAQLAADPVLLVDVLWVLCREQAITYGVSDRAFGECLVGDAIEEAARALVLARADFSPTRTRSAILRQLEMSDRVRAKATELVTAQLEDPELEQRVTRAMESQLLAQMEAALTRLESAGGSPAIAGSA